MARIAFFTERLPPGNDSISEFSYELIRSLADQQHHIHVFSTYREGADLPPSHPRIEIARPFRKWGWLELPRLVPLLMEFRPELIHLIQPRAEAMEGFTSAMSAIPNMGALLGRPAIVSSFYDFREDELRRHRALLLASHAVTVSNQTQKDVLERFLMETPLSRSPKIIVLPVPSAGVKTHDENSETPALSELLPDALENFLETNDSIIFVAGDIGDHREPAKLFSAVAEVLSKFPHSRVVFGGGWGRIPSKARPILMRIFEEADLGARVFITGPLTANNERRCLARARLAFTVSLPPESLSLARILREALEVSTPLLMSEEQARIDALGWRHAENALFTTSTPEGWSKSLADALASDELIRSIRSRLPEFTRSEAVDQPGNVMSRVYTSLLEAR